MSSASSAAVPVTRASLSRAISRACASELTRIWGTQFATTGPSRSVAAAALEQARLPPRARLSPGIPSRARCVSAGAQPAADRRATWQTAPPASRQGRATPTSSPANTSSRTCSGSATVNLICRRGWALTTRATALATEISPANGPARCQRSRSSRGEGVGRRHRPVEHQRLHQRPGRLPHAQHRPHRQRGDDLHRLLRRAELHRRAVVVHHRPERVPHRAEQGRPAGRRAGPPQGRTPPSPPC